MKTTPLLDRRGSGQLLIASIPFSMTVAGLYTLQGTSDGRPRARPGPLLQPLFFLQPSSGVTLRSALHSFDVVSDAIGLATCGEHLAFMDDGGYRRPELWLADGWDLVRERGWRAPEYGD